MSKVDVTDKFFELLVRSELVDATSLDRYVEKYELANVETAAEAADRLVEANILTRFQADRLLHGWYRGFFIGPYKVLNLLGSGGMGSIYLAWDRYSGERVALKVLNDAARHDPGMLARFELEARAGARLNHPDIVRTHEVEQAGHVTYVVMDYVEGINLHELTVLHGPPPWAQTCDFILQAARGLHHAHQHGIVHRDVKPSNLLVSLDGRVRILDFGLALLDGDESEDEFVLSMIFGHDCLGTCDFMPPEQARDSQLVDARADVYGLGCTFYHTLVGEPPYLGRNNAAKLKAHRTQAIPNVRRTHPEIPEGVADIVRKMMAKKPSNRFASMSEVVARLSPFAERRPAEFDFDRVLRLRARDTRRKMAEDRAQRGRTRGGSSLVIGEGSEFDSSSVLGGTDSEPALATGRKSTIIAGDTAANPAGSRPSAVEEAPSAAESATALAQRYQDVPPDHELVPPVGPPLPLTKRCMVLGRKADCDLRIATKGVSGRHCQFESLKDGWYVRNLGSTHGVSVNGVPEEHRRLVPGDRIAIGPNCLLRFQRRADRDAEPNRTPPWMWIAVGSVAAVSLLGLLLWIVS